MSGAGGVNEAVRGAAQARRWEQRMQARSEIRRASRRATAKLHTAGPSWPDNVIIDEPPVVTAAERAMRRVASLVSLVVVIAVGGGLLYLNAVTPGKGAQVAPVLSLMVLVMFGLPTVAILCRNVRNVWADTQ